jgi:hypothetical protein
MEPEVYRGFELDDVEDVVEQERMDHAGRMDDNDPSILQGKQARTSILYG